MEPIPDREAASCFTEETLTLDDGQRIYVYAAHVEEAMNDQDIKHIIRAMVYKAFDEITTHYTTERAIPCIVFIAEFPEWEDEHERKAFAFPAAVATASVLMSVGWDALNTLPWNWAAMSAWNLVEDVKVPEHVRHVLMEKITYARFVADGGENRITSMSQYLGSEEMRNTIYRFGSLFYESDVSSPFYSPPGHPPSPAGHPSHPETIL